MYKNFTRFGKFNSFAQSYRILSFTIKHHHGIFKILRLFPLHPFLHFIYTRIMRG